MTAVPAPSARPRALRLPRIRSGRLLRRELWHNAMKWLLPLLAALFLLDGYRTAMIYPPLWDLRASVLPDHVLPDFVAFAAGVAAWTGSRDGRRRTGDLITSTAQPRWSALLTAWAGTAGWVLAAYGACVAALYLATARQATWGGPPWWPVVVAGTALLATCTVAFLAGVRFPTRFTAPLVAAGAFLVSLVGFRMAIQDSTPVSLLSPTGAVPGLDAGVFYRYLPDRAIVQTMFLGGIALAGLGALGLPAGSTGRLARRAAIGLTAAGLVAAGGAVGLTTTAKQQAHGVVIPALHDAANDRSVGYTPVCAGTAMSVCVHPAYRSLLPALLGGLGPVAAMAAGLPGAPVRVVQVATTYRTRAVATVAGRPPVLNLYLGDLELPGFGATNTSALVAQVRLLYLNALLAGGPGGTGDPAQQAVQAGLLIAAGVPLSAQPDLLLASALPGPAPDVYAAVTAAARRFAALSAARRHAWLSAGLPALRAGHITLEQLP